MLEEAKELIKEKYDDIAGSEELYNVMQKCRAHPGRSIL